jgi:hypothetical protein
VLGDGIRVERRAVGDADEVRAQFERLVFDLPGRQRPLEDVHCFSFSFCRRLNSCSCRATIPW